MIRRPPRSTQSSSSAASDVYKRQHVEWFRPPHWYSIHKMNNRTHRKILAVDGRVGFTGGVGIAEEWTGNCETPENWRDTHLRLEGPSVRDLVGGLQENWAESTRCILLDGHLGDTPTIP